MLAIKLKRFFIFFPFCEIGNLENSKFLFYIREICNNIPGYLLVSNIIG